MEHSGTQGDFEASDVAERRPLVAFVLEQEIYIPWVPQ